MFLRLRQNIQTKKLLHVTYLIVFILLFLSAGQELMHNHEPDHKVHSDCPAHQIGLLFNSPLFQIFFFFITIVFVQFLKFQHTRFIDCTIRREINARAPPLLH
jgi:hypothetical protein